MSKVKKITGVKKAIGDYNRGTNGVIFYNMAQRTVYYEELGEEATRFTIGPSQVVIGYKMGNQGSDDTMFTLRAKITAHYLTREELDLTTYRYALHLDKVTDSQDDPRVITYKKYLRILMTDIL